MRLAFLGCGFITGVHSRHLRRLDGLFDLAYASRDAAKAESYRARFGGVAAYPSYAAAIDDPVVDAVVVAVPPRDHLDLVLRALAAGKHVLVEKPAFPVLADFETALAAQRAAATMVLVGENDHYKPLAVTLRRLLAEGAIGEMLFASFTTVAHRLKAADDWRNDEAMAGGDAFFEEGIHWLHLAGSLGPTLRRACGFRPPPAARGPDRRAKSMLVAFSYDNGAAGTLLYSREVPSLLRGLRLSKLYGRDGIITFESNGAFVLARGRGLPRLLLPGVRDIRGYQAMYRDFAAAIRRGTPPEMSLERAMEDQRLMDQIYASLTADIVTSGATPGSRIMSMATTTRRADVVIVGTGAGGGTMLHALAPTGADILVIERGQPVPSEPENWSPEAVWRDLRYRARDTWLDGDDQPFQPYIHYGIGGNTKYWGAVLYRLRREDFGVLAHRDGDSPAWPIDYDTLAPWYDRAEALYSVHGGVGDDPTEPPRGPYPYPAIPHAASMAALVEALRQQGLHPSPLPLGLRRPGELNGCVLCNTCNSFVCQLDAKSDADVCCVRPAQSRENVTVWTGATATRLITDASGRRVTAVEVDRGGVPWRVEAPLVIVACGAVNSAALLLRSSSERWPDGLANASGLVGRRYMAHLATMMQGFHPWRVNHDVFQKTVAINDFYLRGPDEAYPLGQIQSQGRTHGVMAKVVGDTIIPRIPLWAYEAWVARGVDWLAMTEDLPSLDNRVSLAADGRVRLTYQPNNVAAHDRLVAVTRRLLRRLGFWVVMAHSHKQRNTTHQCGTLVFGRDPATSVLDPFCRAHDVENLFVVDASFFPSSAAVNPALTIIAQALRVADHIAATDLRQPTAQVQTIP